MPGVPYVVGIVVDPHFGDRLGALAEQMPVWIADTPANRAAAEAHWLREPGRAHTAGVTTFRVDAEEAPEAWCADVLGSVVEHHGVYSHNPPVTALQIIGARPVDELRAALAAYGFAQVTRAQDSFRASAA